MMTTEALRDALRHQANVEFPAAAKAGHYPIRLNHCFLRVVYDNLFGQQWQEVLAKSKPAIRQLSDEQLTAALAIGERVIADRDTCIALNRKSLDWRGKRGPKGAR